MTKSALIVWGGWDGHTPEQSSRFVAGLLEGHGFTVDIEPTTEAFADEGLSDYDLIIPAITMSRIEKEELTNLLAAVRAGTGLAGFHGLMCDAFRNEPDYQFMTGGQWVAHPGNIIDYTVNIARADDPIVAGIGDFPYRSEQYYMHFDPSVEVLATTTFTGELFDEIEGVVMPVVWKRRYGKGRVFYSSLGHVVDEFQVPQMRTIFERGALLGGPLTPTIGKEETMAELQLRGINKSFGVVKVIHDVDLDIADGEFVVFVGPSGCGKSTLLRTISGLEEPSAGQVLIGGEDVTDFDPSERGVAMVFQSYALYPHMTVEENLGFGLRMGGMPKDQVAERVTGAARVLELTELLKRKPRQLSGGQRQRVAIGRAIVRQPKAFLFDEPLSNLDAELRVQMRIEIAKLHQQLGATMVYVTHDQVEAMTLADRIVVLRAGKVEQQGSPIDLYDNPDNIFVAGFIGSPRMNFLEGTISAINGQEMAVSLTAFEAPSLKVRRRGSGGAVGDAISVGIRPEHFADPGEHGTALVAKAQVVEQLGGVSYVYAVGRDEETKVTIQQKGHSKIGSGATIEVGIEPGAAIAFDKDGLRL